MHFDGGRDFAHGSGIWVFSSNWEGVGRKVAQNRLFHVPWRNPHCLLYERFSFSFYVFSSFCIAMGVTSNVKSVLLRKSVNVSHLILQKYIDIRMPPKTKVGNLLLLGLFKIVRSSILAD